MDGGWKLHSLAIAVAVHLLIDASFALIHQGIDGKAIGSTRGKSLATGNASRPSSRFFSQMKTSYVSCDFLRRIFFAPDILSIDSFYRDSRFAKKVFRGEFFRAFNGRTEEGDVPEV